MYDTNRTVLGWQTAEEEDQSKRFGYTPQVGSYTCTGTRQSIQLKTVRKMFMYDTSPTMLDWQTEEEKVQFKCSGYTPKVSSYTCTIMHGK